MAENKLLTESLEALLNGDVETAKRKFGNYYDKLSRNAYKLTESEDFEDIADDAEAIVDDAIDAETEEDNSFDDILAAVSELEEKYPSEMTDELVARFDDLKNRIDDLRMCDEGEDCSDITSDALVALEDLKGDFVAVDGMSDEVIDLFNEIGDKLSGEDETPDEIEAAAEVEPAGEMEEEKDLTEAFEEKEDVELSEEGEPELEMAEKDEVVNEPEHQEHHEHQEDEEENEIEDDRSIEDLINDAEDNAASMTELLASLKAEMNADESIEESADVSKVKNPAKAESAGVVKTGMKMPRPAKVDTDAAMGSSKTGSKGKAVNTNIIGKLPAANAAEKMKPVQKPSNKGVADKSVLK